ncbi:MAG: M20/M25/M40 family metallo-hydrolase [Planctomycetota bacterium]
MHLRRFTLASVLLVAPLVLAGENAPLNERIIELERTDSKVMEHLDLLTNQIGPRLTGSSNLTRACEAACDLFEQLGLENAHLEQWGTFPVGFDRSPSKGRMILPEERPLTFGTNAWTAGTVGPVRGRVILAPRTEAELAALRPALHGAWVLQEARSMRGGRGFGGPGGGNRPREGANRGATGAPAAGEGGAGVSGNGAAASTSGGPSAAAPAADAQPSREFLQKLDEVFEVERIAGVVRPARNELIVTGGSSNISWDKLPTRVTVNVVKSQWDEIKTLVEAGKEVVLEFDIGNHFFKGPVKLYNVVADLLGSEWPDEYVVVGGHLDSWDGATGATDNGTGCATTLEAARLLVQSGAQPRRTIRFMLWSGEEQGLLGSAGYVRDHKSDLDKISGVFVHDMGTAFFTGVHATPAMMADFQAIFEPVTKLNAEMPFAIKEDKDGLSAGGSDHASFLGAGVPSFMWDQSSKVNYTETHHTQHDLFERAVPEYQKQSAMTIAIAALGVANLDHMLSRDHLVNKNRRGFRGPRFGVRYGDDEVTVSEVTEGSKAEQVGVKVGDKLLRIDGKPIKSREDMFAAMFEGEMKKTFTFLRAGKEISSRST